MLDLLLLEVVDMIRINIQDRNRIPDARKAIQKVNNMTAKVGYMSDGDLQMIASVHEFGARILVTDKMRGYLASQGMHLKKTTTHIVIPERSFLRTGSDLHEDDIRQLTQSLIESVVNGDKTPEEFFMMVGDELKGKIQEHAIDLNSPVNHPFTAERKGSSNPLVDTGNLIGSMEVKVE